MNMQARERRQHEMHKEQMLQLQEEEAQQRHVAQQQAAKRKRVQAVVAQKRKEREQKAQAARNVRREPSRAEPKETPSATQTQRLSTDMGTGSRKKGRDRLSNTGRQIAGF